MMPASLRRLSSLILAALVLVALLPAANVAAWGDVCNTTTKRICLCKHEDYGLPLASTDVTVESYTTNYPNTSEPVDSVTSVKNNFAGTDVRFYKYADLDTPIFCLPQDSRIKNVGQADNDEASSHKKGDLC
jgi:hypothetical protein